MTEPILPSHDPDEALAAFTDDLLAGKVPAGQIPLSGNRELDELAEMAVRLQQTFGADQPDEALGERIYANLVAEWAAARSAQRRRVAGLRWPRAAGYALAAAAVLIAGVIAVVAFPAGEQTPLAGAAVGTVKPALVAGLAALAAALIAAGWWLARRRRR